MNYPVGRMTRNQLWSIFLLVGGVLCLCEVMKSLWTCPPTSTRFHHLIMWAAECLTEMIFWPLQLFFPALAAFSWTAAHHEVHAAVQSSRGAVRRVRCDHITSDSFEISGPDNYSAWSQLRPISTQSHQIYHTYCNLLMTETYLLVLLRHKLVQQPKYLKIKCPKETF